MNTQKVLTQVEGQLAHIQKFAQNAVQKVVSTIDEISSWPDTSNGVDVTIIKDINKFMMAKSITTSLGLLVPFMFKDDPMHELIVVFGNLEEQSRQTVLKKAKADPSLDRLLKVRLQTLLQTYDNFVDIIELTKRMKNKLNYDIPSEVPLVQVCLTALLTIQDMVLVLETMIAADYPDEEENQANLKSIRQTETEMVDLINSIIVTKEEA